MQQMTGVDRILKTGKPVPPSRLQVERNRYVMTGQPLTSGNDTVGAAVFIRSLDRELAPLYRFLGVEPNDQPGSSFDFSADLRLALDQALALRQLNPVGPQLDRLSKVIDFGLEASWAGAGILPPGNPAHAQTPFDQLRAHSAALFPTLSAELRALWEQELAGMRTRIKKMRVALVEKLKAAGVKQDMSFITKQKGMFSYSGLNKEQMQRLRSEFGIYGVDSGRICVAALNERNLDAVVAAITQVTEKTSA